MLLAAGLWHAQEEKKSVGHAAMKRHWTALGIHWAKYLAVDEVAGPSLELRLSVTMELPRA